MTESDISPSPGTITCGSGACWPEPTVCDECCELNISELDSGLVEMASQWAAEFLWAATGRQYGGCPRTYRPCREGCAPEPDCCGGYSGTRLAVPWRAPGSLDWINLPCGRCVRGCQCSAVSEVILPDVDQVVNVRIDGVDYDPCAMVVVYDRSRVVRVDGGQWPTCQELSRVDGPGTWSITVIEGRCVPAGGAWMTGTLMCEFLKACLKKTDCRLPKRIQTLTRQGVTLGFNDQFENLSSMRTGIWELDAWIEQQRSTVGTTPIIVSPELARQTEQTWPRAGADCGRHSA